MKKSSLVLSVIMILAVLLVGCTEAPVTTSPSTNTNNVGNEVNTPGAPLPDTTKPADIASVINTGYYGKILAGDKTPYVEFNVKDYERATKEGKVILLYFYSDVGTLSKAEEYKLFEAFNDMGSPDMIGFKVHFDDSATTVAEADLAKNLSIKYSRTKVIMKDGNVKVTSTNTWNINDYASQMAAFLD